MRVTVNRKNSPKQYILVESEMFSFSHVKLLSRKQSLNPLIFSLKLKEKVVNKKKKKKNYSGQSLISVIFQNSEMS